MPEVGSRVRAGDAFDAVLYPTTPGATFGATFSPIGAGAASRAGIITTLWRMPVAACVFAHRAVSAHHAPKFATNQGSQRGRPLGMIHLEEHMRVYTSKGGGNHFVPALRNDAPVSRRRRAGGRVGVLLTTTVR